MRLDAWAASLGIDQFDIVWMDLQGADLLALSGMGRLLKAVRVIQFEVTDRELLAGQAMRPDVRRFLEAAEMRLVDEWADPSGYFGDADFLR